MTHRVVVTGLGVCSAVGSGIDTFWAALCAGQSGTRLITQPGVAEPVQGGPVLDLPPWVPAKARRHEPDRMIQLAHAAVEQIRAQQPTGFDPTTALFWGTGYTAIATIEECYAAWYLHDRVRADTVPACMPTSVVAHLTSTFQLYGMSTLVSASCASGMNALGTAYHLLRHGVIQSALVGSSDAPLTPGMYRAWKPLRVLANPSSDPAQACRPFSPDRSGLVLAEGAGAVLLETLEQAQRREAPIWAEVLGFSASTSGGSIVAPDVEQQAATVRAALQSAGKAPTDIDYINAHATGTRLGDSAETATIKAVFGDHAYAVPVSALKGATGHAMGASSSIETVATILALHHQRMPPTINWSPNDPECDLDYVPNQARNATLTTVIKESFGFGGANAVLVLGRCVDDDLAPRI